MVARPHSALLLCEPNCTLDVALFSRNDKTVRRRVERKAKSSVLATAENENRTPIETPAGIDACASPGDSRGRS